MADISYNKTTWVNGSTALNATNLNNIETGLSGIYSAHNQLNSMLGKKVDKVDGKGLSTHDFDDHYKNAIDNLLYVAPNNFVLSASEMNGTFEAGTTITLSSISWSFNKNSGTPSKLTLSISGETDIVVASGNVPTNGSYKLSKKITADTYARLVLTYEKGTISSNTVYATFVHPYYYGVGAVGTDPETLSKLVQGKGSKTLSFSPNKQHIIFAYPKSYGDLKSIKDSNGFENINGFTKTEGGSKVPYNIYTSNEASTNTNFRLTFTY